METVTLTREEIRNLIMRGVEIARGNVSTAETVLGLEVFFDTECIEHEVTEVINEIQLGGN